MQRFTAKIVDLMKQENLYASQGGPIILSQVIFFIISMYWTCMLSLFSFHTRGRGFSPFEALCYGLMAINVQLGCSIYTPTINSILHQHAFKFQHVLSLELLPLTLGFLLHILNGMQKLVILGIKTMHPLMSQLELNIFVWHIAQRPKHHMKIAIMQP